MKDKIFQGIGIPLDNSRREAINLFNEMVYTKKIEVEITGKCFCGENNFQILSRFDRFGLPFGTKICKSCGLITQTIRIHPDSLSLFYETVYWPLINGINLETPEMEHSKFITAPKKDESTSFVLNHISKNKKEVKIFEVGCGAGIRISKLKSELQNLGHNVTAIGCDYSENALLHAKKRGIKTVHGGFEELVKKGKCDVLIMSHLFEHLPHLDVALEQIESLVEKKTIIYIEVPGVIDLENKIEYGYNYQTYNVLAHTFNFSLNTLSKVMQSRNFKLVEGDEFIRSVFIKSEEETKTPLKSDYENIVKGLNRAYIKQQKIINRRNSPLLKYIKTLVKAILGKQFI